MPFSDVIIRVLALFQKEEFDSLRAKVHALWDILEVDSEESLTFMRAVQEHVILSPEAMSMYQRDELKLKKERL